MEILKESDEEAWQSTEALQQLLTSTVSGELTNGDVFWPVRVALAGQEASPSPAELLWVLGKNESLKRLKNALEIITRRRI